jgi:hypothetical protein
MTANRIKSAFLVLACLVVASAASAGERRHHGQHRPHAGNIVGNSLSGSHRRHFVENRRWDRQGDGRRNRPAEIDRNRDFAGNQFTQVRQIGGYYGGAIEAYPDPGNGIYFLRDNDDWPRRERSTVALAPRAKIIDVDGGLRGNAFATNSACSFEYGVCVIRGR